MNDGLYKYLSTLSKTKRMKHIAKISGVSVELIRRVGKIEESHPEYYRKIQSGDMSIGQAERAINGHSGMVSTCIKLPEHVHAKLKKNSKELGCTMSEMATMAINAFLSDSDGNLERNRKT